MRNAAESLMNERVSIWISWEGWGAGVRNATDECEGGYLDQLGRMVG